MQCSYFKLSIANYKQHKDITNNITNGITNCITNNTKIFQINNTFLNTQHCFENLITNSNSKLMPHNYSKDWISDFKLIVDKSIAGNADKS